MKKVLIFLSYVLVAAVAACTALLLFMPEEKPQSKLDELKELIDECFIEDVDLPALEDAAAEAMVEAMGDRWSYYMTAADYQAYVEQMANAYVGIGITITTREDGYIDVVRVDAGGPAEAAGMLPGDVIVAVEGEDIAAWELTAVKDKVRGKEDTQVNITVRRQGQDISMDITRKTIETVVATAQMLEGDIGLVTIVNFDGRCAQETRSAIETLLSQGAASLIFDVRYNPGGYKTELVDILDYLLPEGPLFRSVDYTGKELVDHSDADCLDIPMAVLVNADTYSAAEFFAAALAEYDAALVVGQPTTGKGYFQYSYELSDGSAAVISVGKYTTPNGVSLAGVGITPDVVEEVDEETYMQIYYGNVPAEEDPQIQAAVRALKAG